MALKLFAKKVESGVVKIVNDPTKQVQVSIHQKSVNHHVEFEVEGAAPEETLKKINDYLSSMKA